MRTEVPTLDHASAEFAVTAILARSPSLSEAIPQLVKAVCEGYGWDLGEAWLVHPDRKAIQLRAVWHAADYDIGNWEQTSRNISSALGQGLVGRAWDQCQMQWVPDVREEAAFLRAPQAARIGLRAACAIPLCDGNLVRGVMMVLSREARQPDELQMKQLSAVGHQIAEFARSYVVTNSSEAFLSDVVNSAGDIIAVFRLDGSIEYENAAAMRVLGYTLEELIGKTVFDFIHPDDIPATLDGFQAALRNPGNYQTVELRARHRDGRWIWLESRGSVLQRKSGVAVVVVSRDIGERRQREYEAAVGTGDSKPRADHGLTEGETRVVRLIARGMSNREIADALGLSSHTVKEYVAKASRKLGAKNRVQVAALSVVMGLN